MKFHLGHLSMFSNESPHDMWPCPTVHPSDLAVVVVVQSSGSSSRIHQNTISSSSALWWVDHRVILQRTLVQQCTTTCLTVHPKSWLSGPTTLYFDISIQKYWVQQKCAMLFQVFNFIQVFSCPRKQLVSNNRSRLILFMRYRTEEEKTCQQTSSVYIYTNVWS